ncbi:MAG: InlB B-repeat-containing protein [Peptococcaceae bacterium]|nr:InlB B-repeat-containing protein [Peptococcaceae bacterium]
MRKGIAWILAALIMLSASPASFAMAGFDIRTDSTTYSPGTVMTIEITLPSSDWYTVEIWKGAGILMSLPVKGPSTAMEILIPANWENGIDYMLRVGQGSDIASVGFEISSTTIDAIYTLSIDKTMVRAGDTLILRGTSSIPNAAVQYSVNVSGSGVAVKTGDVLISDNQFECFVSIDSTYVPGAYTVKVGGNGVFSNVCTFQLVSTVPGEPPYDLYVDGVQVTQGVLPYRVNGQFLSSATTLAASLGCTANWDQATQRLTMSKGSAVLTMTIGSMLYAVDSVTYATDAAPEMKDGQVCVPIKVVAASFGCYIVVDDVNRRINVSSGAPPSSAVSITLDVGAGSSVPAALRTGADGKLVGLPAPTQSGYTFNGWYTLAVGGTKVSTNTVFTSDAVIYAQWTWISTGGGGSGGGGGGAGGGPATITGGDGTVSLMYNLSDGVVNLFLLEDEVKRILDETKGNALIFDLSRVQNGTGVTMPTASVSALIQDGHGIQFKMPKGTITFDAAAAKAIASQANGNNVSLSFRLVEQIGLTAAQKAVVKPGDLVFDISVMSGAQAIHNFGGSVTISVPYDGPVPVSVWYLDNAGNLELIPSIYSATTKMLTFAANHLSIYVIGPVSDGVIRIRLTIGSLSYSVGDVAKTMDAAPEIINDRTMVPLRFIAEALGAKVDWDGESSTATVELEDAALSVTIGETAPGMDVPAMIMNDRTMVPLRYVSEMLGCEVVWNPDTQSINITK